VIVAGADHAIKRSGLAITQSVASTMLPIAPRHRMNSSTGLNLVASLVDAEATPGLKIRLHGLAQ